MYKYVPNHQPDYHDLKLKKYEKMISRVTPLTQSRFLHVPSTSTSIAYTTAIVIIQWATYTYDGGQCQ